LARFCPGALTAARGDSATGPRVVAAGGDDGGTRARTDPANGDFRAKNGHLNY